MAHVTTRLSSVNELVVKVLGTVLGIVLGNGISPIGNVVK